MWAPARLGLYGLILVAVFAASGFTANAVVPEDTVQSWTEEASEGDHGEEGDGGMNSGGHDGHEGAGTAEASALGLGLVQEGYQLTEVNAPAETGTDSELSLTVTGPDGQPVTDFEPDHEQEMHLIAVRADGQHFRHVHPERDETGTWSIPWAWEAAGT